MWHGQAAGCCPIRTRVLPESKATVDSVTAQQQNSQPGGAGAAGGGAVEAGVGDGPAAELGRPRCLCRGSGRLRGARTRCAGGRYRRAGGDEGRRHRGAGDEGVVAASPETTVVDTAAKVVETVTPVAQRVVEAAAPIVRQVAQSTPPVVQDVLDTTRVAKRLVDPVVRPADTGAPRAVARPTSFTSGPGDTKSPVPRSVTGAVPQTDAATLARSVLPSASGVAAPLAGAVAAESFATGSRPLAEPPTVGMPALAAPVRLKDPAQTILQGFGRAPPASPSGRSRLRASPRRATQRRRLVRAACRPPHRGPCPRPSGPARPGVPLVWASSWPSSLS